MLISKWLPGGHIGFFWFLDSNFSLALNINSKLKWHNTYIYGQEPIEIQWRHFQNGRLVAILDFLVSELTLVWLWISNPNFSGTILMYMGKSLLISVTSFTKWLPGGRIRFFGFWTAWFRQRYSSLLWNFSFKFHVHVLCGCRQKSNDCHLCRFQNGCLVIFNNVQLQSTHCPFMLCTAQLGGPVLKASGRVQNTPFQLGDKSPKITDQYTAGGSVNQLSQLAKLSSWLTDSTKDITISFWYYNKWFCFYLIKSWVYIVSLTQ